MDLSFAFIFIATQLNFGSILLTFWFSVLLFWFHFGSFFGALFSEPFPKRFSASFEIALGAKLGSKNKQIHWRVAPNQHFRPSASEVISGPFPRSFWCRFGSQVGTQNGSKRGPRGGHHFSKILTSLGNRFGPIWASSWAPGASFSSLLKAFSSLARGPLDRRKHCSKSLVKRSFATAAAQMCRGHCPLNY